MGRGKEDLEDPLYLDLVTVWPPEPMMDKWVFAQCGKTPRWRLGPPELIASTITQKFGVGATVWKILTLMNLALKRRR